MHEPEILVTWCTRKIGGVVSESQVREGSPLRRPIHRRDTQSERHRSGLAIVFATPRAMATA